MTKKLKITLIILFVLAIFVTLLKGVFVVRNINVTPYEITDTSAASKCDDIFLLNNDVISDSILTLSTNNLVEKIEKNNPSIRVVSIVRSFPNTVDISIKSREERISLQLVNANYLICDYDVKGNIVPIRVSTSTVADSVIIDGITIDDYTLGVALNRKNPCIEKLSVLLSVIADRGFSPAYMLATNISYNANNDNFVIVVNNDTYNVTMQFSSAIDTYKKVVSLLSFYNSFASEIDEDCILMTSTKITTGTNIGYYNIVKMKK